jgi:glycerol kinase
MLFDAAARPRAVAQRELPQVFPRDGWVEHDPAEIWEATVETTRAALAKAGASAGEVAAIGITNQRETVVVWERASGKPIHRAIVWQDRRTADRCERLGSHLDRVRAKTGLLLDPYFSATKISWILDEVAGARARAERGDLAAGTIDSFLLWRLTEGRVHATDATNASRTLLFDIHRQAWDDELLSIFGVPRAVLPDVRDSAADFGTTEPSLFGGAIPIAGVAGDQQAATVGQACWTAGSLKATFGTGCFALFVTGEKAIPSRNRLLTTVGWRIGGRPTYALEGSVFSAGSTIQWLRDGLRILPDAAASAKVAAQADPRRRVYLVPAFTGLGAPYWDARARGALLGLTRDVTAADVVRAGLEAVAFQTRDLLDAMAADGAGAAKVLRVDGGMAANDFFLQVLADLLGVAVERPVVTETTALGAAALAGLRVGFFDSPQAFAERWVLDRRFEPAMGEAEREERTAGWRAAVERVRTRPA